MHPSADSTTSEAGSTADQALAPPHQSLLHDENKIIRELLGYFTPQSSSSQTPSQPTVTLPNSSMKDVLLVGLDIDTNQGYEEILPDQLFHIGVSLLDTRSLQNLVDASPTAPSPEAVIDSHQFIVGDSNYCRRARNRFLFGASEPILITELNTKIELLMAGRDAVLVLHGVSSDVKVLRNLGFGACVRFLHVIDTGRAAQLPLRLHYPLSLQGLLETCDIPYANLHAAGNDAHFCLRALLMIAVLDAERQADGVRGDLIQVFRDVARAPRPLSRREMAAMEEPILPTRRQQTTEAKARRKARRAERKLQRALAREGTTGIADTGQVGSSPEDSSTDA